MRKTYRNIALTLLGASTLSLVGCGGSSSTTQSAGNDKTQQAGADTLAEPTYQPKVVESTNSEAQQVVNRFLDCLRRGDEATMNSLLTTLAKAEVKKTSYAIQPVGTPEGKFKVDRLAYPYQDQTVALVECHWSEPASATEPELMMDIVCEVHQEADGWKIAGMAVTVAGEPEPLVIDFEDGQRLEQLMRMANGQPPAGQPVSQPVGNGQTGQIALPGQFQGGQPANLQLPPAQLPPNQNQFGQLPQLPGAGTTPAGTQTGTQAPNLTAPPQLPTSNPQLATPPGGNVLR